MSQRKVTRGQIRLDQSVDLGLDRPHVQRVAVMVENFAYLDSFPHDENVSDLEDCETSSDDLESTEDEEPVPSTSKGAGRKRKRCGIRYRMPIGRGDDDDDDDEDVYTGGSTTFEARSFDFDESGAGMTEKCGVRDSSCEYEYFLEFFDTELLDLIVRETNRHRRILLETRGEDAPRYVLEYSEVTRDEVMRFLCVIMFTCHVEMHRMEDYWTTVEPFETQGARQLMSRKRFFQLLRLLHFGGNRSAATKLDNLRKVRPVLEHLRRKFQEKFRPYQHVRVDDSFMTCREAFDKQQSFGVKIYIFSDVQSNYMTDFMIYTGKDTDIPIDEELGVFGSVVKTFVTPHLHKHHIIHVNHCCSNQRLLQFLKDNGTGACSTMMKKGSFHNEQDVIACEAGSNRDKCMLISSVDCIQNRAPWHVRLFFRLVDMSVLNAYYLYVVKNGKKQPLATFSKEVVQQLVERFPSEHPPLINRGVVEVQERRLVERHFVSPVPATAGSHRPRRRCHVCATSSRRPKRDQKTYYMCKECGVGLCVAPCFREYHTLQEF
ncbi:piggyBac transposable element-derived protein 4-like [Macrobrachium rosenbergii]|uniref:piggyBac transposable element-derived protein 4-like n=1 Tax=Macrobrachium rosenbergii TaxID=79674 RepID=UPI0034D4E26D